MGNEFSQVCDPVCDPEPEYNPERGYKAFVATNKMNYCEQSKMPPAPGSRNPPGIYSLGGQGGGFTSIGAGSPSGQPYSQQQPEPTRFALPQTLRIRTAIQHGEVLAADRCGRIYVHPSFRPPPESNCPPLSLSSCPSPPRLSYSTSLLPSCPSQYPAPRAHEYAPPLLSVPGRRDPTPLPPPVVFPPASRAGPSRADLLSKFDSRFDNALSGTNSPAEQASQEPAFRVPTLATRHSMAGRCALPPLPPRAMLHTHRGSILTLVLWCFGALYQTHIVTSSWKFMFCITR